MNEKINDNMSIRSKVLRFYKDGGGWFDDVAGHTQAQNHTVFGEHPKTIYIHSVQAEGTAR